MVNEELFLDNPLHVVLNKSKLAYRIYIILIANKVLKKINILLLVLEMNAEMHFGLHVMW
jgi:hypothetical protein